MAINLKHLAITWNAVANSWQHPRNNLATPKKPRVHPGQALWSTGWVGSASEEKQGGIRLKPSHSGIFSSSV
ncbi:hypothetical protein AOLI_G00128980 [Acnodon oligacanthus]